MRSRQNIVLFFPKILCKKIIFRTFRYNFLGHHGCSYLNNSLCISILECVMSAKILLLFCLEYFGIHKNFKGIVHNNLKTTKFYYNCLEFIIRKLMEGIPFCCNTGDNNSFISFLYVFKYNSIFLYEEGWKYIKMFMIFVVM